MTDGLNTEYLDTLELPGLNLEVYAENRLAEKARRLLEDAARLWSEFLALARKEGIFETWGLTPNEGQTLEVELHWLGNRSIQTLNREYRDKDSATDVLTFTLFADQHDPAAWASLPVVQLGSICISIEWAEVEVSKNPALDLRRYL
ncbi:MAG TPA: rRNA maturation RNAse YbeY, partial [Oculatellaceae cyanobacterium]